MTSEAEELPILKFARSLFNDLVVLKEEKISFHCYKEKRKIWEVIIMVVEHNIGFFRS